MRASVEGSMMAERFDDGEKDKKKKRRSNRRTKQNPTSSSASEVIETNGISPECLGKNKTPILTTGSLSNSLKEQGMEQGVNVCFPNGQGLSKTSNVKLVSFPPMHIIDQVELGDMANKQTHVGGIDSKSCFEPPSYRESPETNKKKDSAPRSQIGICGQRNFFCSHWSVEAVEKGLEIGDVLKAVFHVNAHNRLEAYCKIDGVPIDVLVCGVPAQNRAVEGDIVAVKIDPLPLWTKMKGQNVADNNAALLEGCNLEKDDEVSSNCCKGNGKMDADYESINCRSFAGDTKVDSGKGLSNHLDPLGPVSHDSIDGLHFDASASLKINLCSGPPKVINAVDKMCSLVNSFPSKRPTGRVVAVIKRSPRREGIVGFLNVKRSASFRDTGKKDAKKNKNLFSEHEYIQLIPSDPKLPNIMLLIRDLPESIKKRLKSGDAVEMDLVAAQIDDWVEESPFPEGHILHIFGRGDEIQPQLDAILFQNAICLSEFSPEALSCLPSIPWELPLKEMQSRLDLRNLCIFTIDPSTATDLDDALSIEKLSNGNYRVGVHISDASYFVESDTALDREAQLRSTSVYMLQKKLPMLPALISEKIGSLNPGVGKLAVSMLLDINLAGYVVDRWIGRTIIQSCCKLSYEHVQDIIDRAFDFDSSNFHENDYPKVFGGFGWPDIVRSLKGLYEISNVLKHKRFTEGALRLDNPKVVILFDEDGIPYDTMFSEQKESNFLVEEYMLLANVTAAEVICRAYPDVALLRRHPEPNMRKLRELMAFCQKHGLDLDTSSSGQFHCSLEQMKEKLKDDSVLYDILISYATRPMQLASYFCSGELKDNEHEWGHYALAVPLYTHFTSPLRRYPDIVVHRTLLAAIEAEEIYMKHQKALEVDPNVLVQKRCFTGINYDKKAAESIECREALSTAALKHRIPKAEILADIAAYCNVRKLASRNVKDACDRLYMWFLLKKKKVLLSEARILGLGPRFMSIYIQKLAIERRINYDEVEGLTAEWLEATSTVVLSMGTNKRAFRRGYTSKWRTLEEVVLLTCPYELKDTMDTSNHSGAPELDASISAMDRLHISRPETETEIVPAVFPLTVHVFSKIPVALHAVGGKDGPIDFGVRLYMSSYFA